MHVIKLFLVNLSTTSTDKERIRLIFFEDIWHDWIFTWELKYGGFRGAGKVKKIQTKFGYENRIWFDTFRALGEQTKLVQRLLLFIKLYKCSLLTFFFRFTSNISYSIYIGHILNIQYKVFLIFKKQFAKITPTFFCLYRRFRLHASTSFNKLWMGTVLRFVRTDLSHFFQ